MIPFSARRVIEAALEEDLGLGDVTGSAVIPARAECRAAVAAREPLVVSGGEIAAHVFWRLDPDLNVELAVADGAAAKAGQRVLYVSGRAQPILAAERTALNLLQHLSGHCHRHPQPTWNGCAVRRRWCARRARPRPGCASWRSTRCAAAAGATTAPRWPTAC